MQCELVWDVNPARQVESPGCSSGFPREVREGESEGESLDVKTAKLWWDLPSRVSAPERKAGAEKKRTSQVFRQRE